MNKEEREALLEVAETVAIEARRRNAVLAQAVEEAAGDRIRADLEFAYRVWGSLANVAWFGPDGLEAGPGFRGGGRMLAVIRGHGDEQYCYMAYYCMATAGVVDPEFGAMMSALGWSWRTT